MGAQRAAEKEMKIRKVCKTLCAVLWYLMVAGLVVVLVDVAAARIQHRVPQIGGFSVFRITTGSMEPSIPAGTYILVRKTRPEAIAQGDIITFYSEDPDIFNLPNTHRVIGEPEKEGESLVFSTQGDANPVADAFPVPQQRVIGRYVCSLNALTALMNFCMTRGMLILLLVVQGISVVMMVVMKKAGKKEETKS